MRIRLRASTLKLKLCVKDGWLAVSYHRFGDGWASLGSVQLMPLRLRADEKTRRRRTCARKGHAWQKAPDPVAGEEIDLGTAIHRKWRCQGCGYRAEYPIPATDARRHA